MVDFLAAADNNGRPTLLSELRAGVAVAVIALPQAMALGMLAFAPLGPDYAAAGALSGLTAAIVGGIVSVLAGGVGIQPVGTRVSAALVFASVLTGARAVLPEAPAETLLTLAFLSMLLGGLLRAGFGLLRLGRLIHFVPRPVIGGFINGLALAVLVAQARPLLGLEHGQSWSESQPASLLAGLTAFAVTQIWPRQVRLISPLLGGLIIGALLYHALLGWLGPAALGPALGLVPPLPPTPATLIAMLELSRAELMPALATVLAGAVVQALVMSVETLMSATALDFKMGWRSDPDAELRAHGIASMAAAACGGLPVTGSLMRSLAGWEAGGRTRLTVVLNALLLLLALLFAGPVLELLPLPVFAGIMLTVGLTARDDWSLRMLVRLLSGKLHSREVTLTVGVGALVAGSVLVTDVMLAVAMGVLVSGLLFVGRMSKPVLRRVADARGRRSLRVRPQDEVHRLDSRAEALAVVELEGPLFFGTAEPMAISVEALAPPARMVVLDMARVTVLDVTGGQVIAMLAGQLERRGATLALGDIDPDSERGLLMREIGVDTAVPLALWFSDTDAALEYAEDRLLAGDLGAAAGLALAETDLAAGCTLEEVALLESLLDTQRVTADTVLFHEGDADGALFLLVAGRVTIRLRLAGERVKRLATYDPGVFFGEMALLQGLPRSADAVADHDSVLRVLTPAAFERLCGEHPALALKLVRNMAVEIANRLRLCTDELRSPY